jgi:hypothetical protein
VGALTDETATIHVRSDRLSTENHRFLGMGSRVEMIVAPIIGSTTIEAAMAGCDFDSELEASVTRRFLEASAASFRAIRIVPLP